MPYGLSSNELIEEEFIKTASVDFICTWLKDNSDKEVIQSFDSFSMLREKYEPVWLKSENDALKISVCLYGRHFETLKSILKSSLPMHFKEAVTKNNALMRSAGLSYAGGNYSLAPQDIIDLYNELSDENQLFFFLFTNAAIEERFLTDLFKMEKPYNEISINHLLIIFRGLFADQRKLFSNNSQKYENSAWMDDARDLANAIVQFIPSIKSISENFEREVFCDVSTLISIKYFLEDTAGFKTDGIVDQQTLILFNVPDNIENSDFYHSDKIYYEDMLPVIQRELASRGISNSIDNKDKLIEFSQSENRLIRGVYYFNAPLSTIYKLEQWKLDSFFAEATTFSLDWAFFDDIDSHEYLEKSSQLNEETRRVINTIVNLIKKDPTIFAAAMAMNLKHYQTKSARKFVRHICDMGDHFGDTFPWPLGNGTCKELFEAQCDKFRLERPEFFNDESSEILLLEKVSNLQEEFKRINSSIQNYQGSNAVKIQSIENKLEGIDASQRDFHNQFSKIRSQILNFEKFIENQIKKPTDVISRILFGIPILGRIFRSIFK